MADKYVPIFYDWIEATQELNAQEKGRLIDAIVLYARGGDWQEQIKGNERYAFPMFRLQVDRAKNVSSVRSESGRIGGEANRSKSKQTEANRSKTPNKDNNNNEYKEEDNNEDKNKESDKRARARFTPPTLDDVGAYAREKGWSAAQFDAERFADFYASKGWRVGSQPMRDWKAAARNWAARERSDGGRFQAQGEKTNPAFNYEQRSYSEREFGDDFYYNDMGRGDGK